MKKLISILILVSIMGISFLSISVHAQEAGTLLPQAQKDVDCKELLDDLEKNPDPVEHFKQQDQTGRNNILACAIKTGKIHFWMIPFYIVYIIQFLIGISGLIAVLFIVIGGYQFVASGATEQKDKAKTTIKNALLGLVVVLVAWVVVNLIQFAITI